MSKENDRLMEDASSFLTRVGTAFVFLIDVAVLIVCGIWPIGRALAILAFWFFCVGLFLFVVQRVVRFVLFR